jgi:hypothetical protein
VGVLVGTKQRYQLALKGCKRLLCVAIHNAKVMLHSFPNNKIIDSQNSDLLE